MSRSGGSSHSSRVATPSGSPTSPAIDPTTVAFKSLADPSGTTVLEQNFEYDLVSADEILSKFIDRPIAVELKDGKVVAGTLLSFDGAQIVLKTEDASAPIQIVARADNVRNLKFGELPGGLITKPTLVWLLDAAKAGEQLCRVAYQTGGMSWNADYTVVTAPDDRSLDLAGWVTIFNQSGCSTCSRRKDGSKPPGRHRFRGRRSPQPPRREARNRSAIAGASSASARRRWWRSSLT